MVAWNVMVGSRGAQERQGSGARLGRLVEALQVRQRGCRCVVQMVDSPTGGSRP